MTNQMILPKLLCDKEVAAIVGMSPSWVRVQRFKRKSGTEHSFTVDPVFIGSSPRYKQEDIQIWLSTLNNGGGNVQ